MTPDNRQDYSQFVEVELVKKDISIIMALCEKFDVTLEKIQEIASNLSRMVSLHEARLEMQEKSYEEIEKVLEMRRVEHNIDIKELNTRIDTVNRELTGKIEGTERKILAEIASLKEELVKDKNTLSSRILNIEIWKWMLMGTFAAFLWIVSKLDVSKIQQLF